MKSRSKRIRVTLSARQVDVLTWLALEAGNTQAREAAFLLAQGMALAERRWTRLNPGAVPIDLHAGASAARPDTTSTATSTPADEDPGSACEHPHLQRAFDGNILCTDCGTVFLHGGTPA